MNITQILSQELSATAAQGYLNENVPDAKAALDG